MIPRPFRWPSTSYGPPIKRPEPQPQPAPPMATSRRGLLGAIGAAACAGGALLIPGAASAVQKVSPDDSRTCRDAKEAEMLLAWRSIDRSDIGDEWTEKSRDAILDIMRSFAPDR